MRKIKLLKQITTAVLIGALVLTGVLTGANAAPVVRPQSTQAVVPGWSYTGNLNTARFDDTATLLPSGRVLVVGGSYGGPIYALTAELYDPTAGTWSSTGSAEFNLSSVLGSYHNTATLLPSGKVLVAGGDLGDSPFDSAGLYDATTGTWSITGHLNAERASHTATLLPNGKVLVVGGFDYDYDDSLNSAELYDPATGTWSSTGSLNTPRVYHTATLLPNGKVLVAGGFDGGLFDRNHALNSAELYDPATGTWSSTGNLNTVRLAHTATLLPGGKVLVAGGSADNDSRTNNNLNTAELYDPATGTWSIAANLIIASSNHTATLLPSGRVLVVGGDSAELYDPATDTWSSTANLNTTRTSHTATLLPNGKVLVTSGNTAELYDAYATSCADSISPTGQSFEAGGGTASVDVTAGSECSWTAEANASWISIISVSSSGSGSVSFSVAANTSTMRRTGTVVIAGRSFIVSQAGAPVRITNALVSGKKLFVTGENFDPGAVILLNGVQQITGNDVENPKTTLIGKKAGKKVKIGDKLQVRNPNGTLSEQFSFTGS
jgi:N-acetylneuraminic acid mutarotase